MSLILTITYHPPLLSVQETSRTLEEGILTIGRAANNDWVLQDPERILSGQHCLIEYRDGNYYMTDTSTNGVFLNDVDERLERDHTVQLNHGDYFTLGDYEITAEISAPDIQRSDTDSIEDKRPATDIAPTTSGGFLGGPPSGSARPDALLNDSLAAPATPRTPLTTAEDLSPEESALLGPGSPASSPQPQTTEPDHLSPERAFIQPPATIPEEEEVTETDLSPSVSTEQEALAEKPALTDEGVLIPDNWWQEEIHETSGPEALSESEQAPLPGEEKPVAEFSSPETPPGVEAAPSLAGKRLEKKSAVPGQKPVPVVLDKATLPSSALPDSRESEPAPARLSRQAQETIVGAFLKGAKLGKRTISEDRFEDVMESIGQIFRETIQGIMEILQARSNVKGEFRLERTTLGPRDNNPLKTPPGGTPLSVEEAMALLLSEPSQGFMSPVQAVQESLEDIKAHQIAVMAGIQSALSLLLERFDPDSLEQRLSRDSMLDNLLPGKRKAKYWDSFKTRYAQLAREAEDDFNEFFGKEFAKAYDKQTRNL